MMAAGIPPGIHFFLKKPAFPNCHDGVLYYHVLDSGGKILISTKKFNP